ncbi:YbaK/EbsC family protein [Pseudomonas sp.]|uniref:YbaK/EbsC family protein n=1 Tax=Pseudomonas sp. TaxID=306 RepID=UPI0028AD2FC4|nr:YbaK/EbsC family protein [Pseudomonas sp.]
MNVVNATQLLAEMKCMKLAFAVQTHAAVLTMAESGELELTLEGERCKNLLLRDKTGQLFLVMTLADKAIDLKTLRASLGSARLSMASHDQMFETLGVKTGALSPLTLINDTQRAVKLVIDSELQLSPGLLLHPLDNSMSVQLCSQVLGNFLSLLGYAPAWTPL